MKIIKFVSILLIFTNFACAPKYYSPNTQQVTLFEDQGDLNLTVALNGTKFEGQAAYAITDQFAGAVNFARFNETDEEDYGSGFIFELAPGYFTSIGDNLIFEAYAQLGFGQFNNNFVNLLDSTATESKIMANAIKLGVQPSIAYKKENFALALSSRFTSLNYTNIEGDLIYNTIDQQALLTQSKNNFLIEPALSFWFGFEKIKFQIQYAYSINLSNEALPQDNQLLSIGLNYNINTNGF